MQILADDPKKPNLFLRLESGRPELLFNTHMDTVPPGDRTTWRHDPLGAQIEGTRLFGRGAADPHEWGAGGGDRGSPAAPDPSPDPAPLAQHRHDHGWHRHERRAGPLRGDDRPPHTATRASGRRAGGD